VRHARVVGNSDQFDGLCRLHRHRNLSPTAKQQIAGPLSANRRPSVCRTQFALCGSPAVRTSLSALTSAGPLSGCGRNEKLITTKPKAKQQADYHDAPVGLSAL
jgi:hypothetical protein